MIDIEFMVNSYDRDGDIVDKGVFLYFNDIFILKLENVDEVENVIERLKRIRKEIIENY